MGSSKMMRLREKLMEELEEQATGDKMDPTKLDLTYKLVESIKGIDKICWLEEQMMGDEEYSQTGSYRGRTRDVMGRYSGSPHYRDPYDGRSYRMSYDDAKFNMVHKLGDLMMCTENEHTKSVLRNAINQLENQ